MEWTDALENINYLVVVVGVAISMVLGVLWYAPAFLGGKWAKLIGFKKKDMENRDGMPVMMAMSAVYFAILTLVLALLFELTVSEGLAEGFLLGVICGFAFGFGPMAVTYGYARRKFELALIDGGYVVVATGLIGLAVAQLAG